MADIYSTEPPTNGKVLIETSIGEIDIELWTREVPNTCKNFIQHCLDGYYDGCIFHRVVKDFIAQTGDPLGTGMGGEGAYEKTFKDEFHQRLRYTRRGLVGMANAGANDNASQFFFTLDATPDLNKKHSLFGKVTGPTIFNMMRLNELDMSEKDEERPKRPPFIKKTTILNFGPFEGMVKRELEVRYDFDLGKRINVKEYQKQRELEKQKKYKSKAVKNFGLLSFGDEAEEEEEAEEEAKEQLALSKKAKSIYDEAKSEEAEKSQKKPAGPFRNPNPAIHQKDESENSSSEDSDSDDEKVKDPEHYKKQLEEAKSSELNTSNERYESTEERLKREKKEAKLAKQAEKAARKVAKEKFKDRKKEENPLLKELHEQQIFYKNQSSQKKNKNKKKREEMTMKLFGEFTGKMRDKTLEQKQSLKRKKEQIQNELAQQSGLGNLGNLGMVNIKANAKLLEPELEEDDIKLSKHTEEQRKKIKKVNDLKEYGFVINEEDEIANKSSSEDDDFDIWSHKFTTESKLSTEAKKFNVNERDAKDATMKKDENTYALTDPRNELNKRRRLESKKGGKKLGWQGK